MQQSWSETNRVTLQNEGLGHLAQQTSTHRDGLRGRGGLATDGEEERTSTTFTPRSAQQLGLQSVPLSSPSQIPFQEERPPRRLEVGEGKMLMEEDLTWGGKHTTEYTDDVL